MRIRKFVGIMLSVLTISIQSTAFAAVTLSDDVMDDVTAGAGIKIGINAFGGGSRLGFANSFTNANSAGVGPISIASGVGAGIGIGVGNGANAGSSGTVSGVGGPVVGIPITANIGAPGLPVAISATIVGGIGIGR